MDNRNCKLTTCIADMPQGKRPLNYHDFINARTSHIATLAAIDLIFVNMDYIILVPTIPKLMSESRG